MLAERGTAGGAAGVGARRDRRPARRAAAAEKELLQEAAVHGKVFWLGAVASASRAPPRAEAEELLRALERKDFVRRSAGRRSPATSSRPSRRCTSCTSAGASRARFPRAKKCKSENYGGRAESDPSCDPQGAGKRIADFVQQMGGTESARRQHAVLPDGDERSRRHHQSDGRARRAMGGQHLAGRPLEDLRENDRARATPTATSPSRRRARRNTSA